jgi:L-alanine-DL-glutamate epimerase-like enolase superfamily enzyme
MDETIWSNGAAKAAIDIALYDIMGKDAGLPLYKLIGGERNACEIDLTIGIDEPTEMAETARKIAERGFAQIKIKGGENHRSDIEAVRLIRAAIGPSIRLKVDANQGWTVGDAIAAARAMAEYDVEAIEQPVRYWDIEGLAYVRAKSPVRVMADESCFTPEDALALIRRDAVDMLNIKLMKCGGLYRAMQISTIAAAAGIPCMLGCMMESPLSIAAGAALIAADSNFRYGDLDSFLAIKDAGEISGGFEFDTPMIRLTDAPGHGAIVHES